MLQHCRHYLWNINNRLCEDERVSGDIAAGSVDGIGGLQLPIWQISLLVVFAVSVRMIFCCVQPCQPDEGFVYLLTRNPVHVIIQTLGMDSHPPTHNLLMRPLILQASSLLLLRLPEALSDIVAVWVCFLLGERLQRGCGVWTGALYALSFSVCLNSCQLRSYGYLSCCIWLTVYMCANVLYYDRPWCRPGRWQWLFLFLSALGAASLHYTGTLVVGVLWAVLVVYALKERSLSKLKPSLCLSAALLPAALWLMYAVIYNNNYMNNVHAQSANIKELYKLAVYICGIQFIPHFTFDWLNHESWEYFTAFIPSLWEIIIFFFWIILLRGFCVLFVRNRKLLIVLFLPFAALLLCLIVSNLRLVQYMQCRHFLPLAPVVYLFLAAGLCSVKSDWFNNKIAMAFVSCILAINLFQSIFMIWWSPLIDYNFTEISRYIDKFHSDNAVLVVDGSMFSMAAMVNLGHGAISFDFTDGSIHYADDYRGPEVIPLHPVYMHDKCEALTGKSVFLVMTAFDDIRIGYLRNLNEYYGIVDRHVIRSYWSNIEIFKLQRR